MLENKELAEKLAKTINMVRNTPESAKKTDESVGAGAYTEVDNTIQTVLKKTEEDPIFNKILDEIIGY